VISRSRSARISPATPIRDFRSLSRSSQRATTTGYVVLLPRFAAWSSHADRKMIWLVLFAKLRRHPIWSAGRLKCRETIGYVRDLLSGNGILLENRIGRFVADGEAIYSYEGTREMNTTTLEDCTRVQESECECAMTSTTCTRKRTRVSI
jgi:hypothetical protein